VNRYRGAAILDMNFHSMPEASQNLHEISADYFSEVPVAVGI
jgi:hypothetical protein